MIRVVSYIDGFNLYHAIDDISRASRGIKNHLKWLDVSALTKKFIDPNVHIVVGVKFFTALPYWNLDRVSRHKVYLAALKAAGVVIVMGQFKEKDVYCRNCKLTFRAHEEKESDVNLATHLINDAHKDIFDQAFVISRDSDLSAPIRHIVQEFPKKKVKIIAPPGRGHSKELWALSHLRAAIKEVHLETSMLPDTVLGSTGAIVALRPKQYELPA